jgi:transposase
VSGLTTSLTVPGMSKPRVIVLSVVVQGLSASEAAAWLGVSRQWVHQLLRPVSSRPAEAVDPRSRRPHANPRQTPAAVAERVVALRRSLTAQGLDAGPLTIAAHLADEGLTAPAASTIRRILHNAGLIDPQPRKRPRSCYRRSGPPRLTSAANRTSPTGPWPTGPTRRSSTSSTTTPTCCWAAPPRPGSQAPPSSPRS